jgi:dolichol-phosphate hexosyltransferase
MPTRATLVVPTINEAASIGHVIRTFRAAAEEANRTIFAAHPIEWEVLVVDGASTDGTPDLAKAEGARVVIERRPGYGRAYKTGFAAATGEILATADGDATYPVEIIPGLVHRLKDESLDFISGNRMAYLDRRAMTTEHRVGNRVLNLTLGLAFHRFLKEMPYGTLADSQSGFWVFRRDVLEHVHLGSDGMAFSEELKIEVILRGLRVAEVPIHYAERWGQPKLSSWKDGYRNMRFIVWKRFAFSREQARGAPIPFARDPEAAPPP